MADTDRLDIEELRASLVKLRACIPSIRDGSGIVDAGTVRSAADEQDKLLNALAAKASERKGA